MAKVTLHNLTNTPLALPGPFNEVLAPFATKVYADLPIHWLDDAPPAITRAIEGKLISVLVENDQLKPDYLEEINVRTAQDSSHLQGRAVSPAAPIDGNFLMWNSGTSQWEPHAGRQLLPAVGEKSALDGTAGTPGPSNRYTAAGPHDEQVVRRVRQDLGEGLRRRRALLTLIHVILTPESRPVIMRHTNRVDSTR